MGTEDLRATLRDLLMSQRLAVLATQVDKHPYTSLVAFAATEDLRLLVFATDRATHKFANLSANPGVAMLVDDRSHREADLSEATAVTATGQEAYHRGVPLVPGFTYVPLNDLDAVKL
jgi:nitroimidazol reductase NimA-like FMN-containing flavoprotein (pyridoxamine 5'-phosphate oxidase superfamily)